jgi:uncharacterized protein (DUF1810 family)
MENVDRFLDAHARDYATALSEIKSGRKQSHWMWYIFPQLKGLGRSGTAQHYGIGSLGEAKAFLDHPVLGKHLVKIAATLLAYHGKSAFDIFGSPDDVKLHSCMTLFAQLENAPPVFNEVLDRYFDGKPDKATLLLLHQHDPNAPV